MKPKGESEREILSTSSMTEQEGVTVYTTEMFAGGGGAAKTNSVRPL